MQAKADPAALSDISPAMMETFVIFEICDKAQTLDLSYTCERVLTKGDPCSPELRRLLRCCALKIVGDMFDDSDWSGDC